LLRLGWGAKFKRTYVDAFTANNKTKDVWQLIEQEIATPRINHGIESRFIRYIADKLRNILTAWRMFHEECGKVAHYRALGKCCASGNSRGSESVVGGAEG
jgi:hypothetical protein